MKSWKTTLAGIAAIIAAIALAIAHQFDADANTIAEWGGVAAAVAAGVGLILARDNDVSSEDAGIKPRE